MLADLHARAREEHPVLIVVDTLQRLIRAKDFSDYAEVTLKFEPLLKLARETSAALLLLTHASTHQKRKGLDAVLGSTALSGSVDQVFMVSRSEKRRTLSSIQRIGTDLEPVVLTLDERTGQLELGGRERDAVGRRSPSVSLKRSGAWASRALMKSGSGSMSRAAVPTWRVNSAAWWGWAESSGPEMANAVTHTSTPAVGAGPAPPP